MEIKKGRLKGVLDFALLIKTVTSYLTYRLHHDFQDHKGLLQHEDRQDTYRTDREPALDYNQL